MNSWTLRSLFTICRTTRKIWNLWWKPSTGRMQVCAVSSRWTKCLLGLRLLSLCQLHCEILVLNFVLFGFKDVLILGSSCSPFVTLVCTSLHSTQKRPLKGNLVHSSMSTHRCLGLFHKWPEWLNSFSVSLFYFLVWTQMEWSLSAVKTGAKRPQWRRRRTFQRSSSTGNTPRWVCLPSLQWLNMAFNNSIMTKMGNFDHCAE